MFSYALYLTFLSLHNVWESLYGVVANGHDFKTLVSEFELKSRNCIHFWTNALGRGMNSFVLQSVCSVIRLMFFCKRVFRIKLPTKVDTNKPDIIYRRIIWKSFFYRMNINITVKIN